MREDLAGIIFILGLAALWWFRWDITGLEESTYIKHDRLTGTTYWCVAYDCGEADE
jgi:hypothetical protein